jgi:hypothetical protein
MDDADCERVGKRVLEVIVKAGLDPQESRDLLCMLLGTLVAARTEPEDVGQVLMAISMDIADYAAKFDPGISSD